MKGLIFVSLNMDNTLPDYFFSKTMISRYYMCIVFVRMLKGE